VTRKPRALLALAALALTAGAGEAKAMKFTMGPEQVKPGPGEPRGWAFALLSFAPGRLCYELMTKGVGDDHLVAHLHKGPAGAQGPVVFELMRIYRDTRPQSACVAMDPALIKAIEAHPRDYYVDVHNDRFPKGAVRGQLP
jgi:hypothetical protein